MSEPKKWWVDDDNFKKDDEFYTQRTWATNFERPGCSLFVSNESYLKLQAENEKLKAKIEILEAELNCLTDDFMGDE